MNIQEINQKVIEKTKFVQSIFTEIGKGDCRSGIYDTAVDNRSIC